MEVFSTFDTITQGLLAVGFTVVSFGMWRLAWRSRRVVRWLRWLGFLISALWMVFYVLNFLGSSGIVPCISFAVLADFGRTINVLVLSNLMIWAYTTDDMKRAYRKRIEDCDEDEVEISKAEVEGD